MMKFISTLLIVFLCISVSSYADDISTTTEDGRGYIDEKPEGDISKQNSADDQNYKKGSNPLINVKEGADNFTMLECEIQMGESGRTALETQAKNTKIERTKITTKGVSEEDNPGMRTVIEIANITIQSEILALKKRYKDDLNILYEDMSRKGQLNGTPMLDRLSKLCLNEIEDCALLIHDTLLRVVENSGVNYSDELAAELKNVAKRHLTGEIGNINEYIKQKNKLRPTLEAQLAKKETELNNERTRKLKKINSKIDLLTISPNSSIYLKIRSWLGKNIGRIIIIICCGLFVTIVGGLILRRLTKSPDLKEEVVEDKVVRQGQKPDTSLASYFQDALSIMPELLMDMARALKDEKTKLIREFFVLRNRNVTIGTSTKPRLNYFEEDYENLQNKLDILEDYGFITDVRVGNDPIYRMTPELVQLLLTDIETT